MHLHLITLYTSTLFCLLSLSACDPYHNSVPEQQQCVNLHHEMTMYRMDSEQMKTIAINRHYLEMKEQYQKMNCKSPLMRLHDANSK